MSSDRPLATAENPGREGVQVVVEVDGRVAAMVRVGSTEAVDWLSCPTAVTDFIIGIGTTILYGVDQTGRVNASAASGHHQTRWTPPPGSSTITLLRHGASEGFTPGVPFPLVDGHGDPALAPDGHDQATQAARRLAAEHHGGRPIDALYVTTLRRTHQTAAPLAATIGLAPVVEPELREVFLGEWEGGLFRQYVAEAHPAAMAAVMAGEWGAVPGAETSATLGDRAMAALERLADRHVDQRVVAVVHGGIIDVIVSRISGGTGGRFLGADNCSITTVVRTPTGWRVRGFNDTSHLDGGWS